MTSSVQIKCRKNFEDYLSEIRKTGDSVGAIIELLQKCSNGALVNNLQ